MIVRNEYPDGRTEIFCNTPDEYNDLCCEYDLEDCGNSGKYVGSSWSHDDKNNVDVYYKQKINKIVKVQNKEVVQKKRR